MSMLLNKYHQAESQPTSWWSTYGIFFFFFFFCVDVKIVFFFFFFFFFFCLFLKLVFFFFFFFFFFCHPKYHWGKFFIEPGVNSPKWTPWNGVQILGSVFLCSIQKSQRKEAETNVSDVTKQKSAILRTCYSLNSW